MQFGHGLIVGKFYPPHAGHHHLIDSAAAQCERVTVAVLARTDEIIPLDDRVSWLTATHARQPNVRILGDRDDHAVNYDDPVAWDNHVAVFAAVVARAAIGDGLSGDAATVDAVFTSEAYGDELARRFGATHVCVDLPREIKPVSGTAVREDLVGHWHHLAPATKAGLARRVVVLGAESSGTTTLARDLAEALRARGGVWSETQWVPEYGRRHTELKVAALAAQRARAGLPAPSMADLVWTVGDFLDVAARQNADEDTAAAIGSPILVCDTDAFTTGVWYERYVGGHHAGVEALGDARRHDFYLLTDPAGVAFEQDGLRDGEHLREWMHRRFSERLRETGRQFAVLAGAASNRELDALKLLEAVGASWNTPYMRPTFFGGALPLQ